MTETPIARARRILAEHDPDKAYQYLDGSRDDYPSVRATVAAIVETEGRILRYLESVAAKRSDRMKIDAIRAGV